MMQEAEIRGSGSFRRIRAGEGFAAEKSRLNVPIILAGYSGSGKDTVSHAVTELAASESVRAAAATNTRFVMANPSSGARRPCRPFSAGHRL